MAKGASIGEIRKKFTKVYESIATSYHESGHTVFALLCLIKINYVHIFEHKTLKRVHGFTYYEYRDLDINSSDFGRSLQQEIGFGYAGLLAERHHFKSISGTDRIPMFIKEGSSEDLSSIRKIINKYNPVPPGKKRDAYKKKIAKETATALVEHWDAVDLIAHALFKHKRLSYQDLQDILTKKSQNKKFWREQFKDYQSNLSFTLTVFPDIIHATYP